MSVIERSIRSETLSVAVTHSVTNTQMLLNFMLCSNNQFCTGPLELDVLDAFSIVTSIMKNIYVFCILSVFTLSPDAGHPHRVYN